MKNITEINQSRRLFIELGTPLLLEPCDPERSVSSQMAGMHVGKYLIVHLSEINWKKSHLKRGDILRVKYVCSDDVFCFDTRILTMIEEPDLLMFLDYPDEVESCNIRSRPRIECYLPVEVVLEDGVSTRKGVVLNINERGCLCLVNGLGFHEISRNSRISLRFSYARFDTLFTIAVVKSLGRDDDKLRLGLMFEELDTYSRTVLSTLVPALKE
ncbi:hypothetical protein HRM2_32250 [Desulforapulum autotrophicum HRM2]|uniref:PilZ domain-containing protein n=1 Tax=Desulforapulum autotrophicum (strain ATCC 43914 / DSM 3382 / VKM B-1955 / HRM2) TaxID=177437 RepID=C0QLK0_DESAH|nr:flagellar brake protein [Desulforapulum autotrophicum]ACN16304.1 hypothetical protein HRM2_32250 [Desulforapulum autotrophicum HRM2]